MDLAHGHIAARTLVSMLAAMAFAAIATSCGTTPASTAATSMTAVSTTQSSLTPTSTELTPSTIEEQSRYEGTLEYECDKDGCWRVGDGVGGDLPHPPAYYSPPHPPDYFYPDIEAHNPDIQALLVDIGVPSTPVVGDGEAWLRITAVWSWLSRTTRYTDTGPEAQAAQDYLESLVPEHDGWFSIDDIAKVYARYRFLPWLSNGGCNYKALIFATLIYRCGIDPDRMAVAESIWSTSGNQHLFVVIRSGDHWYYVDPTCIDPHGTLTLPYKPESIGCVPEVDYQHPFSLAVVPGSVLTRAMLVK